MTMTDLVKADVVVTGANSTIGTQLVPMLAGQATPLLVLGRQNRPLAHGAWQFLDMVDTSAVLPAFKAATLIHTAAIWLLPQWLAQFHACGVRRVIAFSSTSRFTKGDSSSAYELKVVNQLIAAEEQLASECERLGMAWTILRSTLIYGAGGQDRNVSDIARFIRRFGFFPLFGAGSGRRQPVHAADLANACIRCMAEPASYNKAYNLSGGETLTYIDMVRRIFKALGKTPIVIRVPLLLFTLAVHVARWHPRFAHLTPEMARRMRSDLVFDAAQARYDFGYQPRKFELDYLSTLSR